MERLTERRVDANYLLYWRVSVMESSSHSSAFRSSVESSCFTPGRCTQPLKTRHESATGRLFRLPNTKAKAGNHEAVFETHFQVSAFLFVIVSKCTRQTNNCYITLSYNLYYATEVNLYSFFSFFQPPYSEQVVRTSQTRSFF